MNQILTAVIIEDDVDIRGLIEAVLSQSGFEVHAASTGASGVELVRLVEPVVVTLDVGLPDFDGFEVARRIRRFSDSYIVMLTAQSEEADILIGLESGADDYIVKPFKPRELRARVAAMLRRPRGSSIEQEEPRPSAAGSAETTRARARAAGETAHGFPDDGLVAAEWLHNGLYLHEHTRTVTLEGAPVELTPTEFTLIRILLEGGRRVRTKSELVHKVRDDEFVGAYVADSDERSIEVHLGNLRRKLGDDPRSPRWIETVRGVGYRLAPAVPSPASSAE